MQNVIKLYRSGLIYDTKDEILFQTIPITYPRLFKNSFAKVHSFKIVLIKKQLAFISDPQYAEYTKVFESWKFSFLTTENIQLSSWPSCCWRQSDWWGNKGWKQIPFMVNFVSIESEIPSDLSHCTTEWLYYQIVPICGSLLKKDRLNICIWVRYGNLLSLGKSNHIHYASHAENAHPLLSCRDMIRGIWFADLEWKTLYGI